MSTFNSPSDSIVTSGGTLVGIDILRQDVPNTNQGGNTIVYEGYTPEACTLAEIVVFMKTLNTQGTFTATFTNLTTGNTVLSTASFDMQTLSANTWTTLTLTGTASDLTFAADDRFTVSFASNNAAFDGTGVYFTMRFTSNTSFTPRAIDLLFSTTLTTVQTTITTGTLPTGYRDLIISATLKSDRSAAMDTGLIEFNGDNTDSNYASIRMLAEKNPAVNGALSNTAGILRLLGSVMGTTSDTINHQTAVETRIFRHENTSSYKNWLSIDGSNNPPTSISPITNHVSGTWSNTSAISNITLRLEVGDFVVGSSIAVYGLK